MNMLSTIDVLMLQESSTGESCWILKLQFAVIDKTDKVANAGIAPHLNLRPAQHNDIQSVEDILSENWLCSDLEKKVVEFATVTLAQKHVSEVRDRRIPEINKVEKEVKNRLSSEINYWDSRAFELKEQEKAGKDTRLSRTNESNEPRI